MNNIKKILIVTNFYKPHISGITNYVEVLANFYSSKKIKRYILTGNTNNEKKISRVKNVIIIRSKILFNFGRGYFSLDLIKIFNYLSKKIDIINLHFPLVEILPIVLLSRKYKFITFHCMPPIIWSDIKSYFVSIYFYLSFTLSAILTKKIIVNTFDYYDMFFFSKLFRYKTKEIFPVLENRTTSSSDVNILSNNETPIIGFLGRICKEKGIDNIILASRLLNNKNIKHKILICGDLKDIRFKNYINNLKYKCKDNSSVKFLGKINENEKDNFYKKIHFLIFPSINYYESFGIVQLESMSYGKIVLSSNLKGVRIPVLKTNNGIILKNNNPESICKGIIECIELAKIKKQSNVLEDYNSNFSNNEFFYRYLKLIDIN